MSRTSAASIKPISRSPPGVIALTGRNATNRTSLLQAVMAALGSDTVSLKGDADEGHVELTIGDTTYTRTLTRQNGTVTTTGEPYLDDPTVADLFAFLLESNEARRAVARGDDLRDLIMQPIDTDAIQAEIEQRETERRQLDDELDDRETTLEDLHDERESLTDEIETLETEVEQLESEEYTELLDLHKAANQLEFDLGRLESDREDVADEITTIENRLDHEDQLEAQQADLQAELDELRTRIERIEADAIENFNEHMETVLDILDYENIARIWLERTEQTVREGRRTVDKSVFELHVVRTTRSGTAYEDTIEHLSESEREVTGLVFALAGYLVHDLHETVPVMLLDSLEALDADRIATLVEYIEEYAEYLVVALLPEDAAALDEDYQRVIDI
jgi:predicted  nucleic acid-binding Zn-ribbon protein